MAKVWKVTHSLRHPVKVDGRHPVYQSFGVSFEYAADGRLAGVVHQIEVDDAKDAGDVVEASDSRLALLWGILSYQRGLPVATARRSAAVVEPAPPDGAARIVETVYARVQVDAVVVRRISMPAEAALCRHRLD